ncbi:hypothetical protein [Spiroplasma turonicum]|uniref:Uncharacterized protein n=1 Tax=Spiroplasma turonicum TaxID=216946 RepID=A0A0K1P506_9MOLU|nr:hypothetical protein [Spiroplasma turonicum]AKU79396.1 hypothetical protein STURON_00150 [Spiroplasma turonicum]ALX70417.1 hypothetical protein STURO_v1c01480 [Spiroplasma turonicum]
MSKKNNSELNYDELAKKRFEEVKNSDKLMGSDKSDKEEYYIPKRKFLNEDIKHNQKEKLITPRKKKNLPFTKDQKKEIEQTVTLVKKEYKTKTKEEEKFEKKLLKERNKVEKIVIKASKKLESLVKTEEVDFKEVEQTLELHDNNIEKINQIDNELNTLILSNPQLSLKDRRKFIYKKAYNAETERARRLLEMKNKKQMGWSDQNFVEEKKEVKRGPSGWKERLGIIEEED